MPTILFINQGPPDKPAMAAACAAASGAAEIRAEAAALVQQPSDEYLPELLKKHGLEWPSIIHPADCISPFQYDLIIGFCDRKTSRYPAIPGNPVLIHWEIEDPPLLSADLKSDQVSWQRMLKRISTLVDDLLHQGYLEALVQARKNSELILDNLSEGIIAHDLNRKFFFFNRAAEEITGLSRETVLGRDCHAIFPEKFCASHCHFCDGMSIPHFPTAPYPLTVQTKEGEKKLVEMFVVPLRDGNNVPIGVVASMRDITREHELARRLGEIEQFAGIIGRAPSMQSVFQTIREVAESNVPVIILGESGTGKELVASAIHNESNRREHRFVTINCGALPDTLLESELFGHVQGAFTGAIRNKKGRFELADGGTLFLDEIGDISPAMQVKLLRVLQDGTFQKLGSETTTKVNVRIIAATHKDLKAEIRAGRFREDLYYRLCVVPITLPPLKERLRDIPLLAQHFLKLGAEEEKRKQPVLSQETLNLFMEYDWPGNVRELQNMIRYLLVKCPNDKIEPHHLPPDFLKRQVSSLRVISPRKRRGKLDLDSVQKALRQTNGNKAKAARLLGVGRATLYRFLARHQGEQR